MIKGGYKIIDFKDTPFETDGAAQMIEGIYDTVEASYRKPLLLTGLNVDGKEYNDAYAIPTVSGTDYVFTAYGKVFTIQDTNVIAVTNDNSGGGGGEDTDQYETITIELYTTSGDSMDITYTCSVPVNRNWGEIINNSLFRDASRSSTGSYDNDKFSFVAPTSITPYGWGNVKTTLKNSLDDNSVMNTEFYAMDPVEEAYLNVSYDDKPIAEETYVNFWM